MKNEHEFDLISFLLCCVLLACLVYLLIAPAGPGGQVRFDFAVKTHGGKMDTTATAPAATAQQAPGTTGGIRKFRGRTIQCDEAKAPELFAFKSVGDTIDGILLSIQKITLKDKDTQKSKEVIEYTIEREDGRRARLLTSADLSQKISMAHRGGLVSITYLGLDDSIEKNGNKMRRFEVLTEHRDASAPKVNAHGVEVTDEDIPF